MIKYIFSLSYAYTDSASWANDYFIPAAFIGNEYSQNCTQSI